MAGRALRGMLRTADYKGGKALKSCHPEFYHIYSAAFLAIEEEFYQRFLLFLSLLLALLKFNGIFTRNSLNLIILYLWHCQNDLC